MRRTVDADLVVFNLHGMGPNHADVPSMALLPELLYRRQFGGALFQEPDLAAGSAQPAAAGRWSWRNEMAAGFAAAATARRHATDAVAPAPAGRGARRLKGRDTLALDWMPAARYRPYWHRMRAFALPSFYDGRIRINLAGRESEGLVAIADYDAELAALERLLGDCRDPLSGEPLVAGVERDATADPLALAPSQADLVIEWRPQSLGFEHPALGRMGPLPFRRTGGHTGGPGFAWFQGRDIAAADHGTTSAFDVVPTVIDLLGERPSAPVSGRSPPAPAPFHRWRCAERPMTRPSVTTPIPAYNVGPLLARVIDSALDQADAAGRPIAQQVIVVDDGSSDATAAVAEGLDRGSR